MNTTEVMPEEDLFKVCSYLAGKYRNLQEYEDLISEGYMSGLQSIKDGNPKDHTYTHIRKAMRSYYNLKLKPVSIPASGEAFRAVSTLSKGGNLPNDLLPHQKALYVALSAELDQVKPHTLGTHASAEDLYIQQEDFKTLRDIILGLLEDQAYVIYQTLYEGKSMEEILEASGLNERRFRRLYQRAIENIKKELEND